VGFSFRHEEIGMLAQIMSAQFFEGAMLICFGVSWPVAILKTLRTRRTEGKSLAFLVLILVGYLSGIVAKFVRASGGWGNLEAVTTLYALNAIFVATDIFLFLHFRPKPCGEQLR
jgi:lipopolysaccharide export LptBFGC system permease protein LptF